jgi:hypothetical protein
MFFLVFVAAVVDHQVVSLVEKKILLDFKHYV